MYKYMGEKGEVWLNETKTFIESLSPGSKKTVKAVCPECDEERTARYSHIVTSGHSFHKPCFRMHETKQKTLGKKFGRLLVVGFDKPYEKPGTGHRSTVCICKCDCGEKTTVHLDHLKSKRVRSCGCLNAEKRIETGKKRRGPLNSFFGKSGPKSPTYRHDVSEEERQSSRWQRASDKNKAWRKSVFERDNYACQCCRQKGGRLTAHHMNGFARVPGERFNVDNGLTLCESCHKKLHKLLGGAGKSCTKEQCEQILEVMKKNKT